MKLSANRVVLLLHAVLVVLTIVGIYIASVQGSLPSKWQASAAAVGGIIAALIAGTAAVIKFLDGSQKFDALQAGLTAQAATGVTVSEEALNALPPQPEPAAVEVVAPPAPLAPPTLGG